MVGKRTADVVAFRSVSYLCLGLYALMCLLPFAIIVAASFTDEMTILVNGYSLAPAKLSLSAYRMIFQVPQKMLRAYGITIFSTGVGTALGLFLMSMAAYVLNRKDFRYRNGVAFYLYFTTLFSGGLVPYYILMMKVFGLRNNILAIILPNLISVWSVLLMRNFMQSIPDSLYESAKIDGAGDFRIYLSIILPLSASSLATIGLFQALAYWNEWYNAMLFFQDRDMFPLQLFLKNM
ncbi:MAG: carbohydrate ABC transporter permease, partial [Clostridiales bacterium]|nr:carbohydrate ABC transporter permease [Clostridiales bacterium]